MRQNGGKASEVCRGGQAELERATLVAWNGPRVVGRVALHLVCVRASSGRHTAGPRPENVGSARRPLLEYGSFDLPKLGASDGGAALRRAAQRGPAASIVSGRCRIAS